MTEATFKPGNRVRHTTRGAGTVLASPDSMDAVPWTADDGGHWLSAASSLTLIPDTVTVTVEVPRDELERASRGPRKAEEWALGYAVERGWLDAATSARFRLACHDARDRESNR